MGSNVLSVAFPIQSTNHISLALDRPSVSFKKNGIRVLRALAPTLVALWFAGVADRYDRQMGWTSPEARELFQQLLKYDAERRLRECQRVSEALKVVPATQQARGELCALGPEDAERAFRQHPGYSLNRKIESVQTMLELFRRTLADLSRASASFPELGSQDGQLARELLGT
jgi:hypothetical protein